MNRPERHNNPTPEIPLENGEAWDFSLDSKKQEASFSFERNSVRCRLQPNGSIEVVLFALGQDMGPLGYRQVNTCTLPPDKTLPIGPFRIKLKATRAKSKFGPIKIGRVHELVIVAHGLEDSPAEKKVAEGRDETRSDLTKLLDARADAEILEIKGASVFVHDAEGAPEIDASEMETLRTIPAKPDQRAMRTQRIPRAKPNGKE